MRLRLCVCSVCGVGFMINPNSKRIGFFYSISSGYFPQRNPAFIQHTFFVVVCAVWIKIPFHICKWFSMDKSGILFQYCVSMLNEDEYFKLYWSLSIVLVVRFFYFLLCTFVETHNFSYSRKKWNKYAGRWGRRKARGDREADKERKRTKLSFDEGGRLRKEEGEEKKKMREWARERDRRRERSRERREEKREKNEERIKQRGIEMSKLTRQKAEDGEERKQFFSSFVEKKPVEKS